MRLYYFTYCLPNKGIFTGPSQVGREKWHCSMWPLGFFRRQQVQAGV